MFNSMESSLESHSPPRQGVTGLNALEAQADQGDAEAQFGLGVQYGSAIGVGLDFAQAARWYRRAAEQDHALAQYNLGLMFARGQGMLPDDAAAAEWMRKAADGGDAGGQYDLGTRCHRASVDTLALRPKAMESRIEAYKWFHLAAAQGYKDSLTARQRVTVNMTRAEVDEGNRRAAAFVTRRPAKPQEP
jgi:TPR repeat protein